MFCGAAAGVMIALLMWGGWSPAEEHSIVIIFGWSLGGFIAAMVAVIVGLLAGGPVGRFKLAASRDGASIEADGAMILRLLNIQGIAGLARRFASPSCSSSRKAKPATGRSSAGVRASLSPGASGLCRDRRQFPRRRRPARAADESNAGRVEAAQAVINERTANDFETRLADARAPLSACASSPGRNRSRCSPKRATARPIRCLRQPAQAAGQDRLPAPDALTATEQAIQLDELIKWVRRQAAVDVDAAKPIAP